MTTAAQAAQAYPVIYQPGHAVIGSATTRRGAISRASRIQKLACEFWGATLAEQLDGGLAWFVSPHLR